MPIIDGVKYACDPCMRGHRSSKCRHNDRILLQVRKPGRPLSNCPHKFTASSFVHSSPESIAARSTSELNENGEEKGRRSCGGGDCTCAVTTVAIPKVASCSCEIPAVSRLPHENPSVASLSCQSHSTASSPMSPSNQLAPLTLVISSSNRVSKPQQRSKRHGQRGSVGEDKALELLRENQKNQICDTDLSSMKVETKVSSRVNGVTNGADKGSTRPMYGQEYTDETFNDSKVDSQFPRLENDTSSVSSPPNSLSAGFVDIMETGDWAAAATAASGCYGSGSVGQTVQSQDSHQPAQASQGPNFGGAGSDSNKNTPQQPDPTAYTASSQRPQFYPTTQLQYAAPQDSHYQPSARNIFTPPASVQTINVLVTLQELEWLQRQRAAGFFGPVVTTPATIIPQTPDHQALGNDATLDGRMVVNTLEPRVPRNAVNSGAWEHQCLCGPGCNCLGCVSHPYNTRTVEYVKGMQQLMGGHDQSRNHQPDSHAPTATTSSTQSNPYTPPIGDRPYNNDDSNNKGDISPPTNPTCCGGNQPTSQPLSYEEYPQNHLSPTSDHDDEHSNSNSNSGPGDEVSPSAFMYVDYPLGMICSESETGCKCGEGCTCVGCLTHDGHDGVKFTTTAATTAAATATMPTGTSGKFGGRSGAADTAPGNGAGDATATTTQTEGGLGLHMELPGEWWS